MYHFLANHDPVCPTVPALGETNLAKARSRVSPRIQPGDIICLKNALPEKRETRETKICRDLR